MFFSTEYTKSPESTLMKKFTKEIVFSLSDSSFNKRGNLFEREKDLYLRSFNIAPEVFEKEGRKFFHFKIALQTKDIELPHRRERLNRIEARARAILEFIKDHSQAFKELFILCMNQEHIKEGKIEFSTLPKGFSCLKVCQAYSNIYYSSFLMEFFKKTADGFQSVFYEKLAPFINIAWVSPEPQDLCEWGVYDQNNSFYQGQKRKSNNDRSLQEKHTERLSQLKLWESQQRSERILSPNTQGEFSVDTPWNPKEDSCSGFAHSKDDSVFYDSKDEDVSPFVWKEASSRQVRNHNLEPLRVAECVEKEYGEFCAQGSITPRGSEREKELNNRLMELMERLEISSKTLEEKEERYLALQAELERVHAQMEVTLAVKEGLQNQLSRVEVERIEMSALASKEPATLSVCLTDCLEVSSPANVSEADEPAQMAGPTASTPYRNIVNGVCDSSGGSVQEEEKKVSEDTPEEGPASNCCHSGCIVM